MADEAFHALERRRGEIARHLENSARFAQAFAEFKSTGWGEWLYTECAEFGMTFVEKPMMAYGYEVVGGGETLVKTRMPRCTGFVYEWKRNGKGHYVGAWCGITIEVRSPFIASAANTPNYTLYHHFTFHGIGIKDLPDYLLDS